MGENTRELLFWGFLNALFVGLFFPVFLDGISSGFLQGFESRNFLPYYGTVSLLFFALFMGNIVKYKLRNQKLLNFEIVINFIFIGFSNTNHLLTFFIFYAPFDTSLNCEVGFLILSLLFILELVITIIIYVRILYNAKKSHILSKIRPIQEVIKLESDFYTNDLPISAIAYISNSHFFF